MGNANVSERRKSTDGIPPTLGTSPGGGGGGSRGHGHHRKRSLPGHDDMIVGPVDITAGVHQRSQNDPDVPVQRPRATTEVGRSRPVRARSNTQGPTHAPSINVRKDSGISAAVAQAARKMSGAGVDEATPTEIGDDIKKSEDLAIDGKKRLPTLFKYSGKEAKDVYVCGSFTNWQRLRMNRSTKDFVAVVNLPEGSHQYKFLVDGKWVNDKNGQIMEESDENEFRNNVINVQKEDFNAYDALDMDSDAVKKLNANKKFQASDEFGQDLPTSQSLYEHRSGPPILPPHLLQVILNKDTPLSCEPTLLPEPNRVMINHLYALSIKDGVMVLSSTQRFKKKYVTTLLYKPMG